MARSIRPRIHAFFAPILLISTFFAPSAVADCIAALTMTKIDNGNVVVWTATGKGKCFKPGINGGPVTMYLQKNGGPFNFIAHCNESPCIVQGGGGMSCALPHQDWVLQVTDCVKNADPYCLADSTGTDHQTLDFDHSNSLSSGASSVYAAGTQINGVMYAHAPDAWSDRVISYTWLLDSGSMQPGGSERVGDQTPDDFNVNYRRTIPLGGGTLKITVTSCGDKFAPAVVDAGGDRQCETCNANQPPECKECVGEPIRLANGNMRISQIDPLPSSGGVSMKRTYDSSGPSLTWFGTGWSSIFDRALYIYPYIPDDQWVMIWLDGTKRYLFREVQGTLIQMWPLGAQRATLTVDDATGAYILREPNRDIEVVMEPQTGLPVTYRSRSTGRALSISYSGTTPTHVSDSWGTFGWTITSTQHRIDSIAVDGTSLNWQYVYNGGLLSGVNGPGGAPWRSYAYSGNRLTEARDGAGKLIESHTYDGHGWAYTSIQREGDIQSIEYEAAARNDFDLMTKVRETSGAVTNYWIGSFGGRTRTVQIEGNCTGCGTNDAVFAYRPADYTSPGGQLLRMQDARGYVTAWTYDASDRVTSVTRGYKPANCDPDANSTHCRQTPEALRALTLAATSATEFTSFEYLDANWPDRPTRIARSSVANPGQTTAQMLTYDAATGTVLTETTQGYEGTQLETHVTTTALYAAGEGAAFNPGGAFNAAWLTLAQPAGLRKSVDGPRTDAADISQWVYYPIDDSVPAFWHGRVAALRDAAGNLTRFESYDAFGNPTRVVDPNGVATEYTYDAAGRILTSTLKGIAGCDTAADPLCATDLVTTRTYQATLGPLASETRPNGSTTGYEYDDRGRLKAMTRPVSASASERIEYDYDVPTGKKSAERYLSGQPGAWILARSEAFRYDIYGRLIAVDHPDGKSVLYTYDAANNVATVRDENHLAPNTTYAYDPVNRLVRVTQTLASAAGGTITTQYAYDLHGNLTSVADPNGNATTYGFDDFDRMKQQVSPVTGSTLYSYDSAGNLTSTVDANGATTTRSYDLLNRATSAVSSKGSDSETVSWTYDDATTGRFGIGRIASMSDPTGSTTYQYQRRGLQRSETKTIFGAPYATSYGYDADGNRSSMTYPSGRIVAYGHDLADRPTSAQSGGTTYISSASYLPFGPMTQLLYGNGTTKTMRYDTRYRPLENKLMGPAGVIADYNYAEDAVGNITQIHDAVDPTYNRDFGYDDLNRLTTANSGASLWGSGSYTYDRMGNMLTLSLGTSRAASFVYSGTLPRLANVTQNAVTRSVSYDAAGNEAGVSGVPFSYTPRNSLESADGFTYTHDGRGVRTITSYPSYYLSTLSLSATTLYTSQAATGTVTLGAAAPAGGAVVQISSSSSSLVIPSSVTVPAGGTSAVFGINQASGAQSGAVTITATYGFTRTASLTLAAGPVLSAVAVTPASVVGGTAANGTITLASAAPPGGAPVSLTSDSPAAVVPSSISVPAGSSAASFTVTTSAVTASTAATIQGTYGNSATATLTVQPTQLAAFTVQPSSIMGGHPATGTITLNGSAPAGGLTVTLTSATPQIATLPPAVTIPAGATSQTFAITTAYTTTDNSVSLTAALAGQVVTASLSVTHCVVTTAEAPAIPAGDTLWIDDALPAGFPPTNAWDTTQKASGTKSLHLGNGAALHSIYFLWASEKLHFEIGEKLVAYFLVNECARPREVAINWYASNAGGWKKSYWGEALRGDESSMMAMGPIPASGSWIRVEIPANQFGLVQKDVDGIQFELYDGEGWLDHVGKAGPGCTAATAPPPTIPSGDVAWIEDTLPAGFAATNAWDSSQHASGTRSLHLGPVAGLHSLNFLWATEPLQFVQGDKAVAYFLVSECARPREITVSWYASTGGGWTHAYWGEALRGDEAGMKFMGAVPASAQWIRVEVSASELGLVGKSVDGFQFEMYDGEGWLDHVGKTSVVYPLALPHNGTAATAGGASPSHPVRGLKSILRSFRSRMTQFRRVAPVSLGLSARYVEASVWVNDVKRYSFYTPELNLMAETETTMSSTPTVVHEYIWFAGQPVAQIDSGSNATHWTFTDHLGTPILQTDAGGGIDWRAEHDPYGNVFASRAGTARHQPLRFPGQENDGSSERSYNIFRWYRSSFARYTQADPMGLSAGPNVYAYALDDPISLFDRLGLVAEILCKNVGTGGHKIPGAYHCRVRVSCDKCNKGGVPESDSTYGMEYTGNPPYTINEWPYPNGIGPDYTISRPITHSGMSDCQFAKCVQANNNVFKRGYTGKATGKVPTYSNSGPNSNTYAHRLVETCGGMTDFPFGAAGSNDDPWPPFN